MLLKKHRPVIRAPNPVPPFIKEADISKPGMEVGGGYPSSPTQPNLGGPQPEHLTSHPASREWSKQILGSGL